MYFLAMHFEFTRAQALRHDAIRLREWYRYVIRLYSYKPTDRVLFPSYRGVGYVSPRKSCFDTPPGMVPLWCSPVPALMPNDTRYRFRRFVITHLGEGG